jgi:hypothetical protein
MSKTNSSRGKVAGLSSHPPDEFQARPSNRLGRNALGLSQADGSAWQEYLAVCEVQDKLQIRSYFQNLTTGNRAWDEPPSGASHIIPASEEMRRMATLQLDELCVTTGENQQDVDNTDKKRGGFKSLFGLNRKKNDCSISSEQSKNNKKIQYKPGSKVLAATNDKRTDPHLQAAIANSIAESQGHSTIGPRTNAYNHSSQQNRDSDLEMAIALSMSEAAATTATTTLQPNSINEEEEILRQVLEQSKQEVAKAGKKTSR